MNTLDPEVLKAVVEEGRKRGFSDNAIAERLGLPLSEVMRCPGDCRTVGMYGNEYVSPHTPDAIMRLVEKGRTSLQAKPGIALLRKLRREETLALMADTLGLDATHALLAQAIHGTGGCDTAADSLNIPKAAVWAVLTGAFPSPETLQ
jgi:hypothetical protein